MSDKRGNYFAEPITVAVAYYEEGGQWRFHDAWHYHQLTENEPEEEYFTEVGYYFSDEKWKALMGWVEDVRMHLEVSPLGWTRDLSIRLDAIMGKKSPEDFSAKAREGFTDVVKRLRDK